MNKEINLKVSKINIFSNIRQYAVLILLVIVSVLTGIFNPIFFTLNNIVNVIGQVSVLGILGIGMTLVMISGGIDLSVGTALSFIAVTVAKLIVSNPGLNIWIPIAVGLLMGLTIGFLNGLIISYSDAQPFVITLGMMSVYQGLALMITQGYAITGLGEKFEFIGSGRILGLSINSYIFIFFLIIYFVVLKFTQLGRYSYAIGGSEATAFLAGIKVKQKKIIYYTLNGLLVGVAAILFSARIGSALPLMGTGYELQAIAAVVIGGVSLAGGIGNIWGTLFGVLLLGVIANSLNLLQIGIYYQYIILGSIIVIAVIAYRFGGKK